MNRPGKLCRLAIWRVTGTTFTSSALPENHVSLLGNAARDARLVWSIYKRWTLLPLSGSLGLLIRTESYWNETHHWPSKLPVELRLMGCILWRRDRRLV